MDLARLLQSNGYDPGTILVLRHRPTEPRLNRVLPWLAQERHDLFNAYQSTHGPRLEKVLRSASHIASFIGLEPGKALFVGLYKVNGWTEIAVEDYWQNPLHAELRAILGYGENNVTDESTPKTFLQFNLERTDFYQNWMLRLAILFPGGERSWWRRAHANTFLVDSILPEAYGQTAMPDWDTIVLAWDELRILPSNWRAALGQWRGIYLIHDSVDGKSYVGSAYGGSNLLGRWQAYADSGHGGNKWLKRRDPKGFRFSILQRVSPDMPPDEVIALESRWKRRLHTAWPTGLNEN